MMRAIIIQLILFGSCVAGGMAAEVPSPHKPGAYPAPKQSSDHWAFAARRDPKPPAVKDTAWAAHPIDRFIKSRLEREGVSVAAPADRPTLIRRVTYDLIGLPPTPEEIDAFMRDASAHAFENVVERLLASPQYGERWGRHWLDWVRYADTAGDNSDYPIPQAYLYRNYVIDAFNADTPYDRFITEQLAGDLISTEQFAEHRRGIIATGYIASARRFGSLYRDYPQHLTIEDTIDNLGRTFLGLTISCARCHDHKFDPISQADYYGLYGIFDSTRYAFPGIELNKVPADFVPLIPAEEAGRLEADYRAKVDPLKQRADALRKLLSDREAEQKKIDRAKEAQAWQDAEQKVESAKKKWKQAQDQYDKAAREHQPDYPRAYAVIDGKVSNAKLQVMGDPKKTRQEVPRGFPGILGGQRLDSDVAKQTSGRLQLAGWIADPANPLTARVMVNRIWQMHFGEGLVRTPSDFGTRGLPPTHPELLDWLASRFVESGWSIKAMHRLILSSRTYQLSAQADPRSIEADPENQRRGRASIHRMDAESLRDTLLVLSGELNPEPLRESHPFPPSQKWGYTQHHPFKDTYEHHHRSVYLMTRRLSRLPLFATFDGADPNAHTAARTEATTPVQALFAMNDPFVHRSAEGFSRRVMNASGDVADRIRMAHVLAVGRQPAEADVAAAQAFLARARELTGGDEAAWTAYARALLQTNAFVYIE